MNMTKHQQHLWQSMIDLIRGYLNEETSDFYGIVGKLEGALDATEIKDITIIDQWCQYWTPLEIRRAIEGNNVSKGKAMEELTSMKEFFLSKL